MLKRHHQTGFSLVELILAMAIFSSGLLIITYGIITLIKIYSNGVADRTTQNAARQIADTIVQAGRQGSGFAYDAASPAASYAICIAGANPTMFFIKNDVLYSSVWTGYTSGLGCDSSNGVASYDAAISPSDVSVLSFKVEADYQSGSPPSCNTSVSANNCISLRFTVRVTNDSSPFSKLDPSTGNTACLPSANVCSITNLSTTMTAGVSK